MNITDHLRIVKNALHTGQISAAKVDGQRSFVEVEGFIEDLLSVVDLVEKTRDRVGSNLNISVSGSGMWEANVGLLRLVHVTTGSFREALHEAGADARRRLGR